MKLILTVLLYLTGLISDTLSILRTVPHKYDLMMTSMTWLNAQHYCKQEYNDLATILSDTDWLRVKNKAASMSVNPTTWTGLYLDIYSWRWTLNETPLQNLTFTNWYPGQPDNYWRQELCGIIAAVNQWHDVPCNLLRYFICYNNKFTGSAKFIPVTLAYTWPDARTYCLTYHTDLASAFNSSDYSILAQIRAYQGDSWIGLYRDPDTWKWSDGTIVTNIPWYPGQPNNLYMAENCAVLFNGYFHDERCANLYYFYCHTLFPRKSQTMKLQVKSDGSVFDPAVQSSILQQIKQKLKEKFMLDNSTVAWITQPDGKIFHKTKSGL